MRHWLLLAAAGLLPGLWVVDSLADVKSQAGGAKKIVKPAEVCTEEGCGNYGTSINFVKTPSEAARQAQKEEKLVFVLHVSGYFEDSDFT